jgi:hypothetical protein
MADQRDGPIALKSPGICPTVRGSVRKCREECGRCGSSAACCERGLGTCRCLASSGASRRAGQRIEQPATDDLGFFAASLPVTFTHQWPGFS